jgi:serine/threonine protein kinase/tetratricopeptide (TPR) repeat protein
MSKMYREGDRPIPGFKLIAFLGEGGFGEVWKASNESNIEVALKIISLEGKQSVREVFAVRKLRNIRHPNLIPILGFWLKDEAGNIIQNAAADSLSGFMMEGNYQFFVSMGLGDKTLMDRFKECQKEKLEGIPLDELLEYMDESARALDFLNTPRHDMGGAEKVSIEHCDIKPQNILLVGGSVQICDFGLARIQQQGVKQNQTMSFSHNYVAPEMLKREQGPGRTTDQYSLAISYVQLRTGRLPFQDVSFAPAVLTAHLEGKLDYSMLLPAEQKIVKRATALRPEDRYPTARAFVDALKEMATTQSRPMKPQAGLKGPLRPGTEIVPGYKLEEIIGRGSFGEVWRATAPGRMKKAIKIIRNLELASSKQELRSLDLITEVRHPYLIQIEACFLLDKQGDMIPDEAREMQDGPKAETLVIVSELAESHLGKKLNDYITQQGSGLPPKELLSYMRHVAIALDKLNNEHDVIHRDVKPENILLVGGIAKLADFGLAKALEGSSAVIHTKSIGMTPAYAAPELCSGRIEKSTDQYSLALTYYHLRSGKLATGEVGDLSELIRAHLSNKLDFSYATPLEAEVLRRGAALKSQDRYPNCVSFVQALMACFSQRELPRERAISSAESMEEMPSLQSMSMLDWKQTGAAQASPLMMEVKPATKPTDTVNKLTDTARETVAKSQKSTKKDVTATTASRQPVRRRKSHVARIIVSLLILGVIGGIIALGVMLGLNPKPTNTAQPSSSPTSTSGINTAPTPSVAAINTAPVETKTVPKETKPSPALATSPKEPEPAKVTAKEVLANARKAVASDPKRAAKELLDLASRYQATEAPFDKEALELAADCYARLEQTEPARQELRSAYSSYAHEYFTDRSTLLKEDGKIDWMAGSKVSHLSSDQEPWTLAYRIENILHQDKLDATNEAELLKLSNVMSSKQRATLGKYGDFLQGAMAARLNNSKSAVEAFLKLENDPASFKWSDNRKSLIISTVQPKLAEHQQRAFQLKQWRTPIASADDAQTYVNICKKLESWQGTKPTKEEGLLCLLAEANGTTTPELAKDLLKRWPVQETANDPKAPEPPTLALYHQQFQLLKIAKEPEEAKLAVADKLYAALLTQESASLSNEEKLQLFDSWLTEISSLTRVSNLKPSERQQLARIFGGRGKLIIDNHYAPWLRKTPRLAAAQDDLETALKLMNEPLSTVSRGLIIWQAYAKRELKHTDWQTGIKSITPSNAPTDALPVLRILLGNINLEKARTSKKRDERLDLVSKATEQFTKVINENKDDSAKLYWLNLGRLGASQAYLEHANYLEIGDKDREACRKYLTEAVICANDVARSPISDLFKADVEMALGNAKEDFGLLLNDPKHDEAIRHFKNAINTLQGHPLLAKALMNRARAMIRAKRPEFSTQIDTDLSEALKLNPDNMIASEIYRWQAYQFQQAKKYPEAKTALQAAVRAAKNAPLTYFGDDARCALLELVMNTPLDISSSQKLKDRIQEITFLLPKLEEIDPQVRAEAEYQQLNGMNEICNCAFLLVKLGNDAVVHEKLFSQYVTQLKISTQPLAHWHAAKQEGKWLVMKGQFKEAWQAYDMSGTFVQELDAFEKLPANTALRLKLAFMQLAASRFELLTNHPKVFADALQPNVAVLDRVRKLISDDFPFAGSLAGYAGFLRNSILRINAAKLSDAEATQLKTEALKAFETAVRIAPQSNVKWGWLMFMVSLEDNLEKKEKYQQLAIDAIKQLPDSEMSAAQKKANIETVQKLIPK